ncbi:hypothetical protein MY8738_003242, partial [Beauveria namnaoensis]
MLGGARRLQVSSVSLCLQQRLSLSGNSSAFHARSSDAVSSVQTAQSNLNNGCCHAQSLSQKGKAPGTAAASSDDGFQ